MMSIELLKKLFSVPFAVILIVFQNVGLAAADIHILDNGGFGTSSIGTWSVSSGTNPYGSNSVYSRQAGANYTFRVTLATPGEYQVFARWTEWGNRLTAVPYDIAHLGGTSTINVNQQTRGGQWNQLGATWSFDSTAIITIRSVGGGTVSADAIKLVPVGSNLAPVVQEIANKSVTAGNELRFTVSATDSDGAAPTLGASGMPANAIFIDNNNGTGNFSWSTMPSDLGIHNISFIAADTSDPTVTGKKTVTVSVVDGSSTPQIIDNGSAGTSSVGSWKVSSGSNPYGNNSLYSKLSGDTYTFNFKLSSPGAYKVFAWWTDWSNRSTSAPYAITHSNGTGTVSVNQRQNGGQWNQLGSTWNFGSTAKITLRSVGGGATVCADAIKLVPVQNNSIQSSGTAPVNANSPSVKFYHDFENEVPHVYTRQDLRDHWNGAESATVDSGRAKVVKDPSSTGRGNVMQVFYPAGQPLKGVIWKTPVGKHEELYLAYDVMFDENFEWVYGGKLPGLAGGPQDHSGGSIPDGTTGWMGRMMWKYGGRPVTYMFTYDWGYFGPTQKGAKDIWWNDGTGGQKSFTRGKWHRVELYYKMNTPGKSDGVHRAWFDGELAVDMKLGYRTIDSIKVDTFVMSTFYGGMWSPSRNQYAYFDNFIVSTNPLTH